MSTAMPVKSSQRSTTSTGAAAVELVVPAFEAADGDCGIDAEDERAARRMKIVGGNRMPGHPVEVAGEPRQLDGKPRATRRDNPQRPNRTGLRADEADAAQTARDLLVELQRDHTRSAVHRGAGGGHGAYEVGVCGGRAGQGERQAGYAQ